MKKTEYIVGFILLAAIIFIGAGNLASEMLVFRLLMGLLFGYALTRSYMGFAGSVNKAYTNGSTKLMKALMGLFMISALMTAGLLVFAEPGTYGLWVNPINVGLIIGGLLFGFGMAFSLCCASGVLTDIVTGLPRAGVTLVFFALGVFLGFPIQKTAPIVTESMFKSSETFNGVFLPDLFKWDGVNGYFGALVLIAILCLIVVYISDLYEKKRRRAGTYTEFPIEVEQSISYDLGGAGKDLSLYERLFVKPWSMRVGVMVLAAGYMMLMVATKSGWGASTPYGHWFGQFLATVGVSPEALEGFTHVPAKVWTIPFFSHPVYVQNLGIMLGTLISLLLMGKFVATFKEGLKVSGKELALFGLGGFLMGMGTRFANGCNLGALYTPIANLSLSGWVFMVALVGGGILGNMFKQRVMR